MTSSKQAIQQSAAALWEDFSLPIGSAQAYIDSLRGRGLNVFFRGEPVVEPVDDPVIFPSINAMAETYRLASEQQDLASVPIGDTGHRTSRFLHVPVTPGDLAVKHEMQRELGHDAVGVSMDLDRPSDGAGRGQIQDTTPDPLPRAIAPNAIRQSPEVPAATVARRKRHHSAEWRLTQARPRPTLHRSARCPMPGTSSKR